MEQDKAGHLATVEELLTGDECMDVEMDFIEGSRTF